MRLARLLDEVEPFHASTAIHEPDYWQARIAGFLAQGGVTPIEASRARVLLDRLCAVTAKSQTVVGVHPVSSQAA
ncbi:hypothetical protein [Paraburkholderia sp.]|uniref:hypothetical protein n=1 Tax=Paraburkholderia sp. TaxID=1926495 RepID=UPI0023A47EEF|nr:hypothetical protein [Paraburkholderia sp.]MDE1181851.1 hypothetical protein [Paraburkholderia sp.]